MNSRIVREKFDVSLSGMITSCQTMEISAISSANLYGNNCVSAREKLLTSSRRSDNLRLTEIRCVHRNVILRCLSAKTVGVAVRRRSWKGVNMKASKIIVGLASLTLVLAACSSGEDDAASTPEETTASESASAEETAEETSYQRPLQHPAWLIKHE